MIFASRLVSLHTENTVDMSEEKIALLGFGDIACRLAPYLFDADIRGVKRRPISDAPVDIVQADCRDQQAMDNVMSEGFDVVVMTFTPTSMSDEGYKEGYVDTVATVLQALKAQDHPPRLVLFVSSTSVYAQQEANWIDESSVTEPTSYSGRRLLEAEQLLADSGYPYCCVRFSGIYGPGRRRLIEQVIAGHGSPSEPVLYTNRIHVSDCAGVLAHLIQRQKIKSKGIESLYIASDCEPVPLHDVKQWMAHNLGLSDDHLSVDSQQPARMLRSSKRCSNKKLVDSGYQFIYPTFREGYIDLLKA